MAFNLRGVIALDGEAELRKAVTNINSSLRELKSELANTEEKFSGQANSMNALQSKYDTLSSAVEQSRQKQKALSEIIEIAKSKQKEAANELDKLNKKYEEAKKQLEEMKSSNSSSTEEITQQEQAVKDLSSQLGSAKKKYLDTETSVNKWNTSLNKAQTETSQFENELNKTGQYLDEAKSSANGCAVSIDEFGNETKEAATQTSSWADKLRGAVANKAVYLGIDTLKSSMQKLAEAAKEVVEVGSDFEASMSKVAAISGATGSDLDALTAKAKEMGESTKYTASEAADAFSYMALAGWDTEEMLSGIDGVLNLAAAADMDLAEASDIVTDYLTAFGLTAQDSAEFVDMMAYAMANSNTTVEDLGEAYKNCAATASSLGYSAEEVTAVLSTMANAGVKGGEAGTALNTIMTRLATNTKSCGDALAEYGVDIYDSEGNMNSLSSILEGMSGIWETLSDEQQANLAKTIAGTNQYSALQTVMSGLSDEAKKSGKSFSDYSEALEDCTGTAEEMAETMQDNLQGDMTKMESALQTLANEAYGYVSGPLRSAVQGVTSLIGGITDIISPQESELQSLVSSAQAAEAAVSASIENRNTTLAGAEQEATQVELLGNRLMELSGIENKTTAQKAEMEQIVEQLSGSIPELASAYDAETGSLSMTNEELQNYITAQKESIVTQAMLAANEDLIASLVEAQTQLDNVNNTIEDLSEQNDIYDSQIAEIEQLEQAYEDGTISQEEYQNGLMGIAMQYEDLLSSGQISMNTLGKDLQALKEDNSDTLDSLIEDQEEYQNTIDEGTEIINQNAESAQKLSDALLDAADSTEEASESTKNYALAVEDSAESVDESTESFYENSLSMDNAMEAAGLYSDGMKRAAASTDSLAETSEDAADSTEDLESSLDDATTAAEKAAEAYDDAFNNIYDAYTSTMESIKSDLQNKLDLSSKFDGGDDNTTETMNANLESQVEGLKTYQENLEKVRQMTDETGQSIFSDELLSQIEGQGTDMANMLEHIVWTWENQGEYGAEQVQGIADKWTEYLDISDEIATAGAANETAYQLAMGELGSTDLDFSNLRENVEAAVEAAGEGWSGLTDETEAALQSAIDTAQSMGVQIPDGLAEAIASGETSAEQATEQLNSAIQGTLEGLLQVAEESGATVDETLVSSITNGTADAQSAMQTLMDAITDGTSDSGVGSAVETAVGEGTEAIEEASDTYSEGGGTLAESLAEGISENSDLITDAVTEALETGAEATDTVLESYTEAGKEVANAIADGITNNTGAIADALSDAIKDGMSGSGDSTGSGSDLGAAIVEAALESLNGSETMTAFEAAGNDAALAYNAALGAWGENAATEIQALVDSATSVLNDALTSYEAYGNEASGAYAYALASQGTAAADQAKALANQALAALEAQQNEFHTAGYNMSAGMAQGIASGASLAIEAAKNMASQALAAAKAELDIQSPSKKFKKDVGENIGKGMAFGIKDSANLATTEAETMSSKVYKKASAWLTKYKQSQEVSLSDEKYYWKQVLAHCEEGTSAYTKVLTKYNDTVAQIIKNGVSTTTTTGSGSNQKTVAKDTETYYSDVYEAAEDYMDKLQTISDVSLEEQLSYWKSVQKQLKKGTDAWYDAQKEINSINDEIYSEIVSEAEQALSNKKVLEDVSIQDEIDYWKEVRKQIVKEGGKYTDEWYEVTQTIKDLKDDYYDEIYS
ncbi:MAG: phage tail tape measure protein, partial [Clostridiales bacterium]|nr:phage tail tape measure protein [Clostridiales bacterium]